MDIYIHKSGRDLGPLTPERVKEGLAHGDFSRSDHAWREGLADWIPLGDIIQSAGGQALPPNLLTAPSPAGKTQQNTAHIFVVRNGTALGPFTAAEVITQMEAGIFTAADVAKHSGSETLGPILAVPGVGVAPVYSAARTRSPSADASAFGSKFFAGFWVRFAAYMVDGFVLYLPYLVIKLPLLFILHSLDANDPAEAVGIILLSIMNSATLLIMYWLYNAISEASPWQATIGKKLFGLQVVDLNGQRLTFGRASGRFFAKLLSLLTLGIGCIMVAFTERKQALHDIMAGALVVSGGTLAVSKADQATGAASNTTPKVTLADTTPVAAAPPCKPSIQQRAASAPSASPPRTSPRPHAACNPGLPPALAVAVIVGVIGLVILLFVQSKRQVTQKAPVAHPNSQENDPVIRLTSMTPTQAYTYGYGQIKQQFDQMVASVKDDLRPESVTNQIRRQHGGTELTPANVEAEMRKACAGVEQDQEVKAELRSRAAQAGVSDQVLDSYLQGRMEGVIALNRPVDGLLPANGASQAAAPSVTPSANHAGPDDDTKAVEKSPLGDLAVVRSRGNDGDNEIWLDCADDSRRSELLCTHDWRSGQISFSPDERWIVVTDGGGPGSSMGTELRVFRRDTQNLYVEIPDAGIAEAATRQVLRRKGVSDTVELGHVYAEVHGWSADGKTLKLGVWGHGPGYPDDGVIAEPNAEYKMAMIRENHNDGPPGTNTLTTNLATPAISSAQEALDSSAAGFSRYVNSKHQFSCEVPAILAPSLHEEPSGDATSAVSADGRTKLLLRVKHAVGTLKTLYKQWTAEHTAKDPGKVVNYKTLHSDWFVVSGCDGPRGYYVKVVVRGFESLFLCLEYDEKQSNDLETMVTRMSRSFTGSLENPGAKPASSTPTIPEAAEGERQTNDLALAQVYQQLMRSLTATEQMRLRNAERSWIKYRDVEAALLAQNAITPSNPYQVGYVHAQANLSKDRTEVLKEALTHSEANLALALSAPQMPALRGGSRNGPPVGSATDSSVNVIAAPSLSAQRADETKKPTMALTRVYSLPELELLAGTRPVGAGLRGDFMLVKREGNQVLLQSRADMQRWGITGTTNSREDVYLGHTFVTVDCHRDMSGFIKGGLVTIPADAPLQIVSVSRNTQGHIDVMASF